MSDRQVSDAEVDRALSSDDAIVPTSGFARAVMARVGEEAAAPRPLAFPWARALPGLAAIALSFAAALFTAPVAVAAALPASGWPAIEEPVALALVATGASLALSWALSRALPVVGAWRRTHG